MMKEPVADFGAPSRSGAAAGCWFSGSALSASHGLGGANPSATISFSMRISSSAGLRRNGKREPSELNKASKRILNAAGRSITGNWYCFWLVALRLTAMIRSQWLDTTGTIGSGLRMPPSTSMRLPCITGVNRLGMAAEARMA
ncbi:hypothetical protein D9M71_317130 [compost metagenome]